MSELQPRREGIPTVYKGIRFRSRLEATWAAFFDRVGWEWQYEPFDRPGWIPDFALRGAYGPVLAEVKPITDFDPQVAAKIDAADTEHEVLLLGIGIFDNEDLFPDKACLGWLREKFYTGDPGDEKPVFSWARAVLGCWIGTYHGGKKNPRKVLGFCHEVGWFGDRITGCDDEGACGGRAGIRLADIHALWAEAKNTVQWQPSR